MSASIQSKRITYGTHEVTYLESRFSKAPKPTRNDIRKYSDYLGIPERNIKIWFKNRKQSCRKFLDHRHSSKFQNEHGSNPVSIINTSSKSTIRFSTHQRRCLENHYQRNRHPNRELRLRIAKQIDDTLKRVERWFCNKRFTDSLRQYDSVSMGSTAATQSLSILENEGFEESVDVQLDYNPNMQAGNTFRMIDTSCMNADSTYCDLPIHLGNGTQFDGFDVCTSTYGMSNWDMENVILKEFEQSCVKSISENNPKDLADEQLSECDIFCRINWL